MSRRTLVLAFFAIAIAVAIALALRPKPPGPVLWQGYAEADFVKVGPTQQGLVTAVHVQRGDRVASGQPLFEQDDTSDRAAVAQAEQLSAQARAQLANLRAPAKGTLLAQAQANLADAAAARDRVAADLARNRELLKTGAATAQIVDQEQADLRSGEAKIAAMRAALDNLREPIGRDEEVEAQQAAVAAADAALGQARWRLDQRRAVAPVSAVVADLLAQPGETLAAGAPVVSLLPPANIYVRFFVPEPNLASLHIGSPVAFHCDGCAPDLRGRVSFVAPQAEFTPPFIYSESTKGKFVYLAEARFDPPEDARLNPGEPVEVEPVAP